MRVFRGAAFFVLSLALLAKEPDWRPGKLLNLDVGSQTSMKKGKSKICRTYTFSVDGGDKVYDGAEVGKTIHLDVNGPVEYAIEKDHLFLKDSRGKSYKLDLVKTTLKQ